MRSLILLLPSTPLHPLSLDLGVKRFEGKARLRPLLDWRRCWTSLELAHHLAAWQDGHNVEGFNKTPGFTHQKDALSLGMPDLLATPADDHFPSKVSLKEQFWLSTQANNAQKAACATLSQEFLDFKSSC